MYSAVYYFYVAFLLSCHIIQKIQYFAVSGSSYVKAPLFIQQQHMLAAETQHKASLIFLPLPFPSPPPVNVHSQGYPCVFIDNIGHAHSWDNFQKVGGNSSIKSSNALLGHNVVKQRQHGEFRGSLH